MNKALIAALKRNDRKEIIVAAFDLKGDLAEEIRSASRVTPALIDRVCNANDDEPEYDEPCEPECDAPCTTAPVPEKTPAANKLIEEHNAIVKAIKKGKGKKALKLIKQSIANGARGSVISNLKKQAKELI